MRHHLSGRQLSRNSAHRHALMRNMATSLLRHEAIRTTLPKAKELRRVVEPLITLAKSDTLTSRRRAFDQLRDNAVVEKLFVELGPRYQTRPGGYTRILRMFPRPGDAAPMALMELVDRPEAAALAEDEAQTAKDAKKDAKKAKAEKAVAPEAKAEEKAKRKAKKAEAIAAAKAAEAEEAAKPKKKKTAKKKVAAKPAARSAKKKR